ncbi:MAG: DNA polymerase III subunit gamma/tau [Muribaculaceae bacterium]|nr:DNA polymerase III subunit gamma/tau [Muribaculaceae bacterium]
MAQQYIVSARKYRPSTFRTVVGQDALTHTLKSAIAGGRLAHAYLFCGPRGVGKTTCARIFAKTINCTNITPDGEACNECDSCRAFNEQQSFNIIELDAASNNGVDDIRNLTEQVRIPPQTGRYKVYIIDEVHMLSQAAFNAFLKTLEEPPEYAIFILATTEKQKVIPTILSRCQIYDFTRITVSDIVKQLQYICEEEHIQAEPAALNVIAQKADGGMRDALSIFDQVTASSEGNITYRSAIDNLNVLDYDYYFRLVECFLSGNVPESLLIYKEIRDRGFDSQFFVNGLAQHLRDLMVASTPATRTLLEMNDEVSEQYVQQAAKIHPAFFYRALDLCNTCDLNYRTSTSKQLLVELTLVKLCQIMAPTPLPTQQTPAQGIQKIQSAPAATAPARQTTATKAPASQASAPQQPKPAPQPTTASPPAADRPKSGRQMMAATPRIYINKPNDIVQAEEPSGISMSASAVRREAFDENQLLVAWQQYIDAHPHEQVIINTMLMATPQKVNDTLYEIYVENQGQVQFMESRKASIMQFLRDAVKNDMLAIDIKVNEGVSEKRIWTPREVVEGLKQNNPKFTTFLKDFGLGLA